MVKMILYVQKGIPLTETLKKNLKTVLGDFKLRFFDLLGPGAFDFSVPYQDRINSILNAFDFLLEHSNPPEARTASLRKLSAWLRKKYTLTGTLTHEDCKAQRGECFGIVLDALMQTFLVSKTNAKEWLNLAEQYDLLQKGRPEQATLSEFHGLTRPVRLLQVDRWVDPLHPDTKEELQSIKESKPADNPLFQKFLQLSQTSQSYLLNLRTAFFLNPRTLKARIQEDIGSTWFSTKNWNDMKDIMAEINRFIPNENFSTEHFKALRKLPFWYFQLSQEEQRFLRDALQTIDVEHCNRLPSRLRSIPALANAGKHSFYKVENEELYPLTGERVRNAHLASRQTKDWSQEIQDLHCRRNLKQIFNISQKPSGTPLFEGTLITPISKLDSWTPDYFIQNTLTEAIASLTRQGCPQILPTNFMVNLARDFYYVNEKDIGSSSFLAWLNIWLEEADQDKPEVDSVRQLTRQYEKLLKITPAWSDMRELFIAALAHLAADRSGLIVNNTCVSGKDRLGLLLMLADAMALFESLYGRCCEFDSYEKNTDMLALRALFLHLLQTGHQIREAASGAPGAFGIKTLKYYLSLGFLEEINRYTLGASAMDTMASSNDLDKMETVNFRPGYSNALMEALDLPCEAVKTIYTQICEYCPSAIEQRLPYQWKRPASLNGALASREWLAELLYKKETAEYVHWLDSARKQKDGLIQDMLNVTHMLTQERPWKKTSMSTMTNRLTGGMFGSAENSDPPTGIRDVREIMTRDRGGAALPLGIFAEVLFLIHFKLRSASWLRESETQNFYKIFDRFLNERIHEEAFWIECCKPLYALYNKLFPKTNLCSSGKFAHCNDVEAIKTMFAIMPDTQQRFDLSKNNFYRLGEQLPDVLAAIPHFVKTIDLSNNGLNKLEKSLLNKAMTAIPETVETVYLTPKEVEKSVLESRRFIVNNVPGDKMQKTANQHRIFVKHNCTSGEAVIFANEVKQSSPIFN